MRVYTWLRLKFYYIQGFLAMFRKILIANRGEIAARIVKTANQMGISTVVAYSEADQEASYLKEASDGICIGPGPAPGSYLNMEAILQGAIQKDCQALHPGYGFLSENPYFSNRCLQQKLTFIGPPPEAVMKMGDKVQAKTTMAAQGLPLLPGDLKKLYEVEEALKKAEGIGYPILIKASAGGGGRGMKLCDNAEELKKNFPRASRESLQAFGDPALYLEKYLGGAKHIEFQILVDHYGKGIHLGERECSIQRRHQKLIEESPSPVLDGETRRHFGTLVASALAESGYTNAGTVEFLLADSGELYFMEVNARLQVEHPVTEMVTGLDLVKEQLLIAAGHPLSLNQEEVPFKGHAIECRINAEDPDKNFLPSPGTISKFSPPKGEGVRLDTHIEEGYTIPPYYDSMIGKLITWGENRAQALDRMAQALEEFEIQGIPTTIPLLKKVLSHQEFQEGTYNIQTLERIL